MSENFQNNPQDLEQNPIGNEISIEVSIPKKIEIDMVNASSLKDYEVWLFISSLACNFLVGFVVATISADSSIRKEYIFFDILCGIIMIIALIMTHIKRKKMSVEKKIIPLTARRPTNS